MPPDSSLLPLSLTRKRQVAKPIPNYLVKLQSKATNKIPLFISQLYYCSTMKQGKPKAWTSYQVAEPTRAEHTKGEEFGASTLFLSPSISCCIHETSSTDWILQLISWSTGGTFFPSWFSDGLIIWITWEEVQCTPNPSQCSYWGVHPILQDSSMMISHHQYHTKPLTDWPGSPTQSPIITRSTNFQPYLFKVGLHTVTAIALSWWVSLKNPFSGAHTSKYLQIKLWSFWPHWFQLSPQTNCDPGLLWPSQMSSCMSQSTFLHMFVQNLISLIKWCHWYTKYKECSSFSETSPAKFYDHICHF